ncbi:hypothetical protein NIES4101_62110 [Calothrix sp. NIES-4101]|nr:hypothetical protein NIES4101_62110 [Calothrix sp. NIES-4101]
MVNVQDLLNILIVALVMAMVSLMIFDFINGLFDLWQQLDNHQNALVQTGVNQTEIRIKNTLPYFDETNKIGQNLDAIAEVSLSIVETFDTASLEELIQKLPQGRIRTAARRLGIADRVDGKYQKLAVLRMQLRAKLESQSVEVAQVLKGLKM